MSNLIHIKDVEAIEEAQYYLDEFNVVLGGTTEMLKFELWLDATALDTYPGVPTGIYGFQFDIDATNSDTSTSLIYNATNPYYLDIQINNASGKVSYAEGIAIVDYDSSNDSFPTFTGTDKLIGTFYYYTNGSDTMDVTLSDVLVVTDIDNVEPVGDVFNWVRPDDKDYVKGATLPAGISGSTYESLSDVSSNNAGSFYLLELATGKLFNATKTGSLAAEYYNCGYTCSYLVLTNWALGTEVTGTNRPDYLYAPESTVANPVYTLT